MNRVSEILARLAAIGIVPTGVADDSRQVRPGDLFLAYPGDLADGRTFIGDALARGAVAILWQVGDDFAWNPAWTAANLQVDQLRALAGPLAHLVCGEPTAALSLIAITGTNGKTTVSQFVARAYPRRCPVIGTLGAGFPDDLQETGFTTPEATTLMRLLAGFRQAGAEACALEASSIGIEEGRMNGARVDVAVFTNITRDHLDYHGSMDAYAASKARLFAWPGLRTAIINLDDPFCRRLARDTSARSVLGYAIGGEGAVRAEQVVDTPLGQRFTLVLPDGSATVDTPLLGRYNISNLLAVAAVLHDAGVGVDEVARRLASLTAPAGRMERLGGNGEPLVVVDYAHTPDALESVLETVLKLKKKNAGIITVTGAGGDRDKTKRPIMARIAAEKSNRVILTSDNPRTEDPASIRAAVLAACPEAHEVGDRAEAILRAVDALLPGDALLIAGKGHESGQVIGTDIYPFDDVEQASVAVAALDGVI